MIKLIIILIVSLLLEAIGVVFLSQGLKQIGGVDRVTPTAIKRLVMQGVTNRNIMIGIALEAIFFAGLLILLAKADVSLIWPLTSMGFVLTTAAAKFIRHEEVTGLRWTGVVLIMVGAALVGWSEKQKSDRLPPASVDNVTRSASENQISP
jgi:drug/metabolite transporter (DMT)-like permease